MRQLTFIKANTCPVPDAPKGRRPGYVIDHVTPLACGGADHPDNMQWQTTEQAKLKDKWERRKCGQRGKMSYAD